MTIRIDKGQIQLVAEALKNMSESDKGLNFCSFNINGVETFASDLYPKINHPYALNFFFFAVMHNFGFWYGDDKGYLSPLCGTIKNKKVKGSDLLWKTLTTELWLRPWRFEPAVLASISLEEFTKVFSDDKDPIIWPDFETRFRMTRAYGRWFVENGGLPADILLSANQSERPLEEFILWTRQIPGYNRDPLDKKNLLLAMVLANRPEGFLQIKDPESWRPIVDYHLMRLALRLGIVEFESDAYQDNIKRKWVKASAECEIRWATYKAMRELIGRSGRPMSYVDEKMWMGRKYCPEMTNPECDKCIFESVCKRRIALFQPVFRTTNY